MRRTVSVNSFNLPRQSQHSATGWLFVEEPDKTNFTFSGCGFLGIYHLGVISCLKHHAPKLIERVRHFGGASAGALSSTALLFNLDLQDSVQFVMYFAGKAHGGALGPFSSAFDPVAIIRKMFTRFLPENAHQLASGKLHISLTRVSDWKNVVVSEYKSKRDLIDALICTSFVPFYSGIKPPKFRGVTYVDGGLTDNLPQHFEGTTITVSPFSGESDICPDDSNETLFHFDLRNTSVQFTSQNLYRMSRAFFPPSQEILCEMCRQGFRDALKYLHLHYPELLNIGIARIRIPECCIECDTDQNCDEDDGRSTCSYSSDHTSCSILSETESAIAERKTIIDTVVPDKLDMILQSAKEVISDSDLMLWHLVRVLMRAVKWLARPYIYTIHHMGLFAQELIQWMIPRLKEISKCNYYVEGLLNLAIEVFHAYKNRCEHESISETLKAHLSGTEAAINKRHPDIKDEDLTDMVQASARIQAVQKHMKAVPIEEPNSRKLSTVHTEHSVPKFRSFSDSSGSASRRSSVTNRVLSDSSMSTPKRCVAPPNMAYLGLSPSTTGFHSQPKKCLDDVFETVETESDDVFETAESDGGDSGVEIRLQSFMDEKLEGQVPMAYDSFDEFVRDFVVVDEEE